MDLKLFEKEYDKKGALALYPLIKEIFENKFTKEFMSKFDPVDIIIDLLEEAKKLKQFDKIIEIAKIIKENHLEVFKEAQQYIDDDLIDYYLFHNNKEKLEECIDNFIANPIETIDEFLINFKKLVFYSQMDLADKMIVNCFDEIENSDKLLLDPTADLRAAKFNLVIENLLADNKVVEGHILKSKIENFGMELNEDLLPILNLSIADFSSEDLINKFVKDKDYFISLCTILFPKYVQSKNIRFPISSIISQNIIHFLSKNSKKKESDPNKFFFLKQNKFDEFLGELTGGMFSNNIHEVFCTLWGSYYFFDFFKSINLIDEKTYKSNIDAITNLKSIFLNGTNKTLWLYSFVTNWDKPDGMEQETYNNEKIVFINSYATVPE